MALLPAVNEKATREAVREFFDSEWPRIVNMADMGYVDLKSVEISDMPSARSLVMLTMNDLLITLTLCTTTMPLSMPSRL